MTRSYNLVQTWLLFCSCLCLFLHLFISIFLVILRSTRENFLVHLHRFKSRWFGKVHLSSITSIFIQFPILSFFSFLFSPFSLCSLSLFYISYLNFRLQGVTDFFFFWGLHVVFWVWIPCRFPYNKMASVIWCWILSRSECIPFPFLFSLFSTFFSLLSFHFLM